MIEAMVIVEVIGKLLMDVRCMAVGVQRCFDRLGCNFEETKRGGRPTKDLVCGARNEVGKRRGKDRERVGIS